ncbi:MAG: hypothetical protein SFY81_15185 [Verrucomicrobiota bacterium]|nr:hypothetical protein [Verrucomicrobiota bacterium]
MQAWTVIARELRAQSRQNWNYHIRVLTTTALLICFSLYFVANDRSKSDGRLLFMILHAATVIMLLLVIPLLVADTFSRERREGTLGLLFLTPLKSMDIATGKIFAQLWRALSVWLCTFPLFTIPVLMGGLEWHNIAQSITIQFVAFCAAVAGGMVASCLTTSGIAVLFIAEIFALGFAKFLGIVLLLPLLITFSNLHWHSLGMLWGELVFNSRQLHETLFLNAPHIYYVVPAYSMLCGLLALLGAILFSSFRLKRINRIGIQSVLMEKWKKAFFTPRFLLGVFKSRLHKSLQKNPISWLEQRTASARLAKWGWFALILLGETYCAMTYGTAQAGSYLQLVYGFLIIAGMALSASISFREERQNGALELIMVTPLTIMQIIGGRILGLYKLFLPAVLLYLFSRYFLDPKFVHSWVPNHESNWSFLVAYFSTPIVAFALSMRLSKFSSVWFFTIMGTILLPWASSFLVEMGKFLLINFVPKVAAMILAPGYSSLDASNSYEVDLQLAIMIIAAAYLFTTMRNRSFVERFTKAAA